MNEINSLPSRVTNAGLGFSYAVWTPGSRLTLTNVPWDSAYRNVVEFKTYRKWVDYCLRDDSLTITLSGVSYVRPGRPIRVPITFNEAQRFNYLLVYNPEQPVGRDRRRYYGYFINDVRYVAPNTTELDVELDVWCSFRPEVEFTRCFVERGHVVMRQSAEEWGGGDLYLAEPEDLDLGIEYSVVHRTTTPLGDKETFDSYLYVVASTTDLEAPGGTSSAPQLSSSKGTDLGSLVQGASLYRCDKKGLLSLMEKVANQPWVGQGIFSITAFPPVKSMPTSLSKMSDTQLDYGEKRFGNIRHIVERTLPERYRHLKKFKVFPYSLCELTVYNGRSLVIKPELLLGGGDIVVRGVGTANLPAPRVGYYVVNYNIHDYAKDAIVGSQYVPWSQTGETLTHALWLTNLPQLTTVNNNTLMWAAQNANTVAYERELAGYAKRRDLLTGSTAFQNAQSEITAGFQKTNLSIGRNLQSSWNNFGQIPGQILAAGISNGIMDGAGAAISATNSAMHNAMETANQNNYLDAANQTDMAASGKIASRNQELANYVANNDYARTISGILARVNDSRIQSPTLGAMAGGDTLNFDRRIGITAVFKMPPAGVIRTIGEYWLRYGYAANFWLDIQNLQPMSHFCYWKCQDVTLESYSCPELYRKVLRGILEQGVTVWSDPAHIGKIDPAVNRG